MSGKLDPDVIRSAKEISILSLAQRYTTLKPCGSSLQGGPEFSGPCPKCGGTKRFKVSTGSNRWSCRHCTGMDKWEDTIALVTFARFGDYRPVGTQFMEAVEMLVGGRLPVWSAPRIEAVNAEIEAKKQAALAKYSTSDLWAELHRRLTGEHRAWWEQQGIPSDWQDFWRLGYTADKPYMHNRQLYHSPAMTIPYFVPGEEPEQWRPINLQYRLLEPVDPGDKYRWQKDLGSSFFRAFPDMEPTDEVFITEGAKKGMVFACRMVKTKEVLAIPSMNDTAGVVEYVKGRGRQWIVIDPDGTDNAMKLAGQIGPTSRVVALPGKLDDLILAGMKVSDVRNAMRYARPPARAN